MSEVMSCPHCAGDMSITPDLYGQTVLCPHCGKQLSIPGQQAPAAGLTSGPPTTQQATPGTALAVTALVLSIVVTLLCQPLGIPGIVFAAIAIAKNSSGDHAGTRTMAMISFIFSGVGVVIGLAFFAFIILAGIWGDV